MTAEFRSRRAGAAALVDEARAARVSREDALVRALEAGVECRTRQRAYFGKRSQTNLIAAKEAEASFDRLAQAALAQVSPRHPATTIGE